MNALRLSLFCWPLLFVVGCPVDERPLEFGFAIGSKGHDEPEENAGAPASGEGGAGSNPAAGGDGSVPSAGTPPSEAGAPPTDGGSSNGGASAVAGNASMGGGGTPNGGSSTSGTGGTDPNGGTSGSDPNGGTGGTPDTGPCGDVDDNGVEDCDETLVDNASFDTNFSAWTAEFNINQTWSAEDARGKASSGALIVANMAPSQGEGWGIAGTGQCLTASDDEVYEVGARARIPMGQQGRAVLSVVIFGNDGCKGTFLKTVTPALLAATGNWQALHGSVKMPPATRSFYVRLAAEKPNAQPSLEVHFDDVLVRKK